jgi:methane/ammonia monooxygenase subunit C
MSVTQASHETQQAIAADSRLFDRRPLAVGLALLFVIYALARGYEQIYGWSAGLDSYAPEFGAHWATVLTGATPVALLAALGLPAVLWRSRDRDLASLAPRAELKRLMTLLQLLVLFAIALYFGLSFFMEQTAVWHMTAVRDSDFTPSNIITFHVAFPIFCIAGVVAFFYARTRLPQFAKGQSLPFVIFVAGTFMTIPNVGLNEWGHSFWLMEEGFASPVHWGFVFFGWMSLGVFGVTLQILARIRELVGATDASRA